MNQRIGSGMRTSGEECRGQLRLVETIQDVLQLMKEDLSEVVIFTRSASATTVTPLFAKIKGVICTSGGATSHLAIVAREFDLPCLMGAKLDFDGELNKLTVRIDRDGNIYFDS